MGTTFARSSCVKRAPSAWRPTRLFALVPPDRTPPVSLAIGERISRRPTGFSCRPGSPPSALALQSAQALGTATSLQRLLRRASRLFKAASRQVLGLNPAPIFTVRLGCVFEALSGRVRNHLMKLDH